MRQDRAVLREIPVEVEHRFDDAARAAERAPAQCVDGFALKRAHPHQDSSLPLAS